MRRTCVWVAAFRNSVFHKILSEFLQPLRYVGIIRVFPYLLVILFLIWFLVLVGLFNNSSDVSEEYGSPRTCLSTLSLDTIAGGWSEWSISVEDAMGVEVDELGEDLGWSISCLKGVMGVVVKQAWGRTRWQTRNHDWYEVFRITLYSLPFLMRCGFWPLIHSYEYPCSSQSFPSDKTAGVFSRTFIVKKKSILWHTLQPVHASALLHWRLGLS